MTTNADTLFVTAASQRGLDFFVTIGHLRVHHALRHHRHGRFSVCMRSVDVNGIFVRIIKDTLDWLQR